ncbi:MAG TPA: rod shape-determining protein MreC [Clostridiaceae bacterium]|nr:rod shape-determining protein MreC [Clostridiaceae bacterium]
MSRLSKNRIFLLILITLLIFVFIVATSSRDSKLNWINNILSVPLSPIQKFFTFAGQKIDEALSFFRDIEAVKQENEELRLKVHNLEQENRELIGYREKIKELREALKLKDIFEDYEIIGANIISRDAGNWSNIFRIDVGNKDGIDVDFPVITSSKGLVGRIMITDITSSKVITIIEENSSVAGWIARTGGHVVVRGDMALKEEGLCRMDYIPVDVEVEVGDIVETSGLGGIYPKGIIIGKVVQINKTSNELDRYAIIEPAADFKRLEEVFVLKNKVNVGRSGSVEE